LSLYSYLCFFWPPYEIQRPIFVRLVCDTGSGQRASIEAIKAALYKEFGDECQVFVIDLWSDHTPWQFKQLPRGYNFFKGIMEDGILCIYTMSCSFITRLS
ncbi:hypothetical protein TorRG33x02_240870, partial [Trema orientale]